MSESGTPDRRDSETHPERQLTIAEEAARRRRLERIFGDVLPEGTRDDRPDRPDDAGNASDDWLRGQVPPHHGG